MSASFSEPRTRVACLILLFVFLFALPLFAQEPVINPAVSIDQKKLDANQYPLPQVLRSGMRFFTTPYQPYNTTTKQGDGYGEGLVYDAATGKFSPNTMQGPRWQARSVFYRGNQVGWPFLRLNGLDSQSCYECHNSIGSYRVPATQGGGYNRKPGSVGGSAGSNSNAFINTGFPNPLTYLVRNPPHVFGTGYTQTLADEMSAELLLEVASARSAAHAKPNTPVPVALSAKGISFGTFRTTFTGKPGAGSFINCKDVCDPGGLVPYAPPTGYTDDVTDVTGVSCDIVVRPFQWKGIASSIRHFVRDAMDFHFSMQAEEKYGTLDCDGDGKTNEMTLGNVAALTSFVTMTRPPRQVNANDPSVMRGRTFFNANCATCHVPSMKLYSAQLFIEDPGVAQRLPGDCIAHPQAQSLISPNSAAPPTVASADLLEQAGVPSPDGVHKHPISLRLGTLKNTNYTPTGALPCPRVPNPGSCIDLTTLPPGTPDYTMPRLPRTANVIDVPIFSDLKTHDMGPNLADVDLNGKPENQGTDVAGLCITSRYFLTRPLWGVADTGPWLHDGRALTLTDAVLMHGGEGQDAATAFGKLPASQQQDVINFLLSLELPCLPSVSCPPPPPPSLTASATE